MLISVTWFILGLLQITCYLLERRNQYITITKDEISRFTLFFSRTIEISEIKKIIRFRYSYRFETESKKLDIDKEVINKDSIDDLDKFIEKLNLHS